MDCYLVTYDIPHDRRRNRVADLLQDYGARVQYSVFEVWLDAGLRQELEKRLRAELEPAEDSVRLYRLCAVCREKVEVLGQGAPPEPPGLIIF